MPTIIINLIFLGMVEIEKAKKLFYQFDKIVQIFTRSKNNEKRYSVVYRINNHKGFYIILKLDNNPVELFDAYFYSGDIEKRLFRKYLGFY